jgi:peptidyl-prolyl cis-trans isomerase-like 1
VNRQTCENFAQLAKRGYYNGVIFHRIIAVRHDEYRPLNFFSNFTYCLFSKDFMVQGGDPTGTGKGGTSIYGQKLYVPVSHTRFLCYIVQLTQITPIH